MPPGTTELLYEVLEPAAKPLRAIAVPSVKPPRISPSTRPKETPTPTPPRIPKTHTHTQTQTHTHTQTHAHTQTQTHTQTLLQQIHAQAHTHTQTQTHTQTLLQETQNHTHASILHKPPSSPFDLHGSQFDTHGGGGGGGGAVDVGRVCGSMHGGGAWLRALGKMELLMAVGGYFGSLNTVQAVRLSSPRPLIPQDVRAALTMVARRTELLQCCLGWRWAWPWFRRRTHTRVPFRVDTGPLMDAYYRMLEAPYDMSRGPLWRACLVPEGRGAGGEWRGVLVLAVHHCLTDAFTNTTLMREVLEVLNAALTGTLHLPPLRPLLPPLCDQLLTPRDFLAAAAFTLYKFFTPTFGNFNKRLYFRGAVPRPSPRDARTHRTRVLHAELTQEATTQLRQRCREAGVTVHALVSAAAQVAILHTAGAFGKAAGRRQPGEAWVRIFNCVNLRRYFKAEERDALGCHISIEEEEGHVTLQDAASGPALWQLARRGHDALRTSLEAERRPLGTLASFTPCSLLIPVNYILTRLGLLNLNDNHVITTNMGDLQPLLDVGGGPVTPTHLLRCVSDAYTGHPYTLVLHTFLGRFSLALEYYSTKTAPCVANTFFSTLRDLLLDLAATGAPVPGGGAHRDLALHHDKFCPDDHDDHDHHDPL